MSETEKGNPPRPNKPSTLGRIFRFLLKSLLVIFLLLGLFLVGINAHLKSNKTKILSGLSFLNDGAITFGATDISVFKDFPSATISAQNVSLRDAQFDKHELPFIELKSLHLAASLQELLSGEIELNSIDLKDGSVIIFTDEEGYSNLKSFFSEKNEEGETRGDGLIKILTDKVRVNISNVDCQLTNAIKTTNIHGKVEELKAVLRPKGKDLTAEIEMSIFMGGLTIKEKMGAFATNSHLSGETEVVVTDGNIVIEPFVLSIDNEQFTFSGNYDTQKKQLSNFVWESESTRLSETLPILPQSIREKIEPYQIDGEFYSKTTVSSYFQPDDKTLVHVDFRLDGKDVMAKSWVFKNTSLHGQFVNSLYDDHFISKEEGKGLRLMLYDISTMHEGFELAAQKTTITIIPDTEPQLETDLLVEGRPSDISRWLHNDKFFFKKGRFVLNGKVQGPLLEFEQLIINSEVHLDLKNFAVIYKPSQSAFPFKQMTLYKKQGDADFDILSSTLKNGHDFRIEGGLKNMPALLFEMAERTSSDVNFYTKKIGWTDFLDLFGENGYLDDGITKNEQQKKKSMKETIRGIQYHFQPSLSVAVDTLQYFDKLELHQLRMGVHFENEDMLVLERTTFKYGEGEVNCSAKLDISDPEITPFEFELHAEDLNLATLLPPLDYFKIKLLANMDDLPEHVSVDIHHKGVMHDIKGLIPHSSTGEIVFKVDSGKTLLGKITYAPISHETNSVNTKIALDGDPSFFNDFFKTDQFFFEKGRFVAQLEYDGDLSDFGALLNKGEGTFNLYNSEVYFKPADVTFPLTNIELELNHDLANFNAFLKSVSPKQEINLTGNIQHISELLIGGTGKEIKTTVKVTSPIIEWTEFLDIFTPQTNKPEEKQLALKSTTKGLLNTFHPDVSVFLDTFIYTPKFWLHEVQTGISLRDTATLVLDKTGFKFYDGSMSLSGTMDLGKHNSTPFDGHFQTENIDVAKLLESLNYLYIPSFKDIEKLSGHATMNLDLSGIIAKDGKGLVPPATDGLLDFELTDVVIKGFEPLDELAAKLLMKKRFEELAIAPLTNEVTIDGQDIHIPLMEIQSNAINMFIEGTYSYGDNTNIWVTIPLANLKSPDPDIIPPKRGYESIKWKIFLEVTTGEDGENKFKFHFRKRKFYKQRGILEQYKIDKRKYRELRKQKKQAGN